MRETSASRRESGSEAAYQSKWRKSKESDPRYRASRLLVDARQRAKKSGLESDLDLDWVTSRIEKGLCQVTGISFDLSPSVPARPFTPSLDRINPKLGYMKDNTQVVCWIYNRAKGVHNHSAVVTLAEALCKKTH